MKKNSQIDSEEIIGLLKPNGLLSRTIPGFEPRLVQQQMMQDVLNAYNRSTITLIEAGTGTGKSLAYLIPAFYWAAQHKERTVISTNTIALQEQLIHKDIPALLHSLKLDLKAVLVKGMSNYICLRKLEEVQDELRILPGEEAQEIEQINRLKDSTSDGSRSSLPFVPSGNVWERVGAESDMCTGKECPHYEKCYFFQARRQAQDAQILVVNHHLLFADISARKEGNFDEQAVLPGYSRLIIDEAHHIEEVATEYFASKVSRYTISRTLSRLAADKRGKLVLLLDKLRKHFGNSPQKQVSRVMNQLQIDLPGGRQDITVMLGQTFQAFEDLLIKLNSAINSDEAPTTENKLRLLPQHRAHQVWQEGIVPYTKQLIESIKRFAMSVNALEADITSLKNERLDDQTKSLRFEIRSLIERLATVSESLTTFIANETPLSVVRWIEAQLVRGAMNIHLVDAELDISKYLVDSIFTGLNTVVLCSATMTTNKKFDFIRGRLGLNSEVVSAKKTISEHVYASPFNYKKQALFAVPTDMPSPLESSFSASAADKIWSVIQASRGNAFVLFTSYSMLKYTHKLLEERLQNQRFHVLKQGDDNRIALLNRFKANDRSILFGTDSFWEGVDVVGDALRCVIIVKLPFKVPSEPIIQARTEAITALGGEPFWEYSLPQAIVKFKQGFGRLIRTKQDRGCVICLDPRLLNKAYGKQFLNSLPDCDVVFGNSEKITSEMVEFYKRTHHMTKKT